MVNRMMNADVVLLISLLVVVAAAACYDHRRKHEELKRRVLAEIAWVLEEASDSTVEFIHLLWDTGSWYGAVMVAIFAIVVPSLKMILLILGEIWRCSEVQIISKWACPVARQLHGELDIIAYIFLYYLVRHLNRDPINGLFSLDRDLGFTCYTLFCWGSTISSLGVHLPVLDEGMTASTDTARPWALRYSGCHACDPDSLCGLLCAWDDLVMPWPPSRIKDFGTERSSPMADRRGLSVTRMDGCDVTCTDVARTVVVHIAMAEERDANAVLSIIMLVVFVLGLTLLDRGLSGTVKNDPDNRCNLITLAKHLKKLAMLDVLILGIIVVVLSGSVYKKQGLVLSPGWGLLALAGAECMHYVAYGLVRSFVSSKAQRLQLPIDEFRDRILRHIRENRVTHIQGETGCGKSTRLPQFILEDAQERGEEIRMVVTQPRRMAAVTLARRVASVLGEDIGQGTVGYRISGDTIDGKLCFVTVGYLLQRLVNNPEDFDRYTHVVLDEVHERGVDADLLSMVIKLLMHCCPTVKLIVMSATLQASLFADYFSSLQRNRKASEVLAVGARCHPVEQLFLDDLEEQFDFAESRDRRSLDNALEAFRSLSKGKGKGKSKGGDDTGFKRVEPQISDGLMEVTCSLVQQLAKPGCTVIVFLPGIADITTLFENLAPLDDARELTRAGVIKRADCPRLRIFALHSMIPRQEQEEVFNEVPEDCSHIVLASNIAESSLTLPNVCAVVDLALRRSVQYDTRRLMCCLVTTWCSQSSCKQRRGRAGRTMPGRAVCLVPRRFFEKQLPLFDPPEMLNAPLTKLYLQAKQLCSTLTRVADRVHLPPEVHMDVSAPKALLQEVVQPPSLELLDAAIWELAAVGCLTTAEEDADITPLGQIAIALPCDLRICRLLFLGCLFRCPADALAMAAGLTAPDPFSAPSLLVLKDQREYVQKLDRSFAARRWCDHGTGTASRHAIHRPRARRHSRPIENSARRNS
ncbi:Probable ATP-dependent RNA helicase spindle-E [Durusdinium trenchii]|uniref:Probable ATP-dependent RNA helicase spindle-E n=1 Tax=Durusdinium trenchii TaxID=1381693 RepID=A0ABP0Q6U9_9DINO